MNLKSNKLSQTRADHISLVESRNTLMLILRELLHALHISNVVDLKR